MTTDTAASTAVTDLRERFGDAIVTAADDDYDAPRGAFNILIDQRPEAVAYPSSVTETGGASSARPATPASRSCLAVPATTPAPWARSRAPC